MALAIPGEEEERGRGNPLQKGQRVLFYPLPKNTQLCLVQGNSEISSRRFLTRSARQRGDWCSGSSKKEKVKLREKLRLVTGRSGGRRGGRGTRRWAIDLRLALNPLTPPPAETEGDRVKGSWSHICKADRTLSRDEEWTAWAEEEGVEVEVEGLVEGEAAGLRRRRIRRVPNLPKSCSICNMAEELPDVTNVGTADPPQANPLIWRGGDHQVRAQELQGGQRGGVSQSNAGLRVEVEVELVWGL
ncbi:hypothetical protein EYF80_025074 [Liparis tanakae]|uniref:Uncharacterized protein n=1 Tax=Liparis tanakae TaxID=230148 RepID=A0A4Z2HFL2_9TELE|nr:hypothetical protein EYF80_025074 [Liparis tanakae]